MADMPLNIRDGLAGIGFVPTSVQIFGDPPELDDEIAR